MDLTMYAVLGVSPQATDDELRAAFDARVSQLAQEEDRADTDAARTSVHDARTRLEEAWEILNDPRLRMQYDLMSAAAHVDPPPPPPAAPGAPSMPSAPALHHDQPAVAPAAPAGPPAYHHLPVPPPGGLDTRRGPSSTECQLCGSAPAAAITLRREAGMILVRRSHVLAGTYCRSCGLSLFREMTDKTLIRGWWGFVSFFVNWYTLARNLAARVAIGRLPEPRPNPEVRAPLPQPLAPGRSSLLRLGPLVLVALIVGLVVLFTSEGDPAPVTNDDAGTCLALSDDRDAIEDEVPCDGTEDAVVDVVVAEDEACPTGDIRFESDEQDDALCLTPR